MEQPSATNPTDASGDAGAPAPSAPEDGRQAEQPGFRSRGQARRRARFLRRARELAYRDLGGLVYNLHRFGQRNDPLVLAKLNTLSLIDGELRTIESTLAERRPITVLREAGITACPRCAAIHGSEDRYCPNCGLPMSRHADLPIGAAPSGAPPAPAAGAPAGATHGAQPAAPQHQAEPAPAQPLSPSPPPAQPTPVAQPLAANPATRSHPIASPEPGAPGRSPAPPQRVGGAPSAPASGTAVEEATEIIRPPGTGS